NDAGGHKFWTTATYTEAGYTQPPAGIDVVISGHVHLAEVLVFSEESRRPVQLIAGNGGTSLDWMETGTFTGADVGDETREVGYRYQEFGFVGLERTDTSWVATVRLIDGSVPLTCLLVDKAAACLP